MNLKEKKLNKNLILFVGFLPVNAIREIKDFNKKTQRNFNIGFLYNPKTKKSSNILKNEDLDVSISFDPSSHYKMTQSLLPYQNKLLAITCRGEKSIPLFQKVIPNVPYLRSPTTESLEWSINKLLMRRRLFSYDKKITPKYTVVHDFKKTTLKKIEDKIGFPLVVKPARLTQSMLVSICYHKEELEKVLKNTFKKINKICKDQGRECGSDVLVEQFMEGDMYSVDAYVTSRGKIYFCPFVYIKTGKSIGFDDFFGYQQITPTLLRKASKEEGEKVVKKAIHALGLRNVTAHVELMKTELGWKIIEVGPRIGGFRTDMYKLSYGINHTMNDILIRIPEKPIIPRRIKGYTAVLKIFSKKEGILESITGIKKVQGFKSLKSIRINKRLGDKCLYAKNGGKSVFNITLFNESRPKLLADIRRIEQILKIRIK